MRLGGLGCCCGCSKTIKTNKTIGYANKKYTNIDSPYVVDVANDLNKLNQIDVLWIGEQCQYLLPDSIIVNVGAISAWIATGKRLIIHGEYMSGEGGCYSMEQTKKLNQFMTLLGSNMKIKESYDIYDCGCNCKWKGKNIPQDIAITAGIDRIYHACTGEVLGGTPLAYTHLLNNKDNKQVPYLALEAHGNGWILLTADSSIFNDSCRYDNQAFLDNFLTINNLLLPA